MSSEEEDERNVPQNANEILVLPQIHEIIQSEPNVENQSQSHEKSVDDKSDEIPANDSRNTLCAPPRRRGMGSLRRTCSPDSVDSSDTTHTQSLQTNQKPICESLPQTHSSPNDDNNVILVAKCGQNTANDSNHLLSNVSDNCKQFNDRIESLSSPLHYTSTQIAKSYVRSTGPTNSTQNTWNRFEELFMQTMRRWKSRWFTSDEAKATRKRRLSRFLYYIKTILTHLFSTTGLCLLVIAYSCMGAFIFAFLESQHEEQTQNDVEKQRQDFAIDLWNQTNTLNILYPERWINETNIRLKKFEEIIVKAVREDGYGGTSEQWTFSGALLYSVTVITTIGYGNVTCKTDLGRIVTMIYALLGIPVMFLCLANLGNLMAETFRFSYKRLCCLCFCCCNGVSTKPNKTEFKPSKERIELKTCDKNLCVDNGKEVRVIFNENDGQTVQSVIALTASTPPTVSDTSSQPSSPLRSFIEYPLNSDLNRQNSDLIVTQESTVKEDDHNDRVPIWLVILLVISYIMAGAFMFSLWEEGWGPLEGAYFCFTTLTTIGFGDLVPGSAKYSDNKEEQTKFIICCAYLIVGLSLLAMSFNLVQEEIVIKSKAIATRMGFIPQKKSEFNKTNSV